MKLPCFWNCFDIFARNYDFQTVQGSPSFGHSVIAIFDGANREPIQMQTISVQHHLYVACFCSPYPVLLTACKLDSRIYRGRTKVSRLKHTIIIWWWITPTPTKAEKKIIFTWSFSKKPHYGREMWTRSLSVHTSVLDCRRAIYIAVHSYNEDRRAAKVCP